MYEKQEKLMHLEMEAAANASKLIEKYFLDLRNVILNQENIRNFFAKQEIHWFSWEKISCPFCKKINLDSRT